LSQPLDIVGVVTAAQSAMGTAVPDAAAELLLAQLPFVEADAGRALLDRSLERFPPEVWTLLVTDDALDAWPAAVAERFVERARMLPRGRPRIEALCRIAKRLDATDQGEALEGVLDGTLPAMAGMNHSNSGEIERLVRSLPPALQEEWIARKASARPDRAVQVELDARRRIDRWPEEATRALWSRLPDDAGVPQEYLPLARHLPADLRAMALARIRACPQLSTRRYHLVEFGAELTDEELLDVVANPWNDRTRHDEGAICFHLLKVAEHLSRVPMEARQRWLAVATGMEVPHLRQQALVTLLPHVEGDDQRAAIEQIVALALVEGGFTGTVSRWDLLPAHALPALAARLASELGSGWDADELIAHVIRERPPELARSCFLPLLDGFSGNLVPMYAPERKLEVLTALTPWLAAYTANAFSLALAAVEIPPFAKGPDRWYRVRRMHQFGR
jgi:hypothetical protein